MYIISDESLLELLLLEDPRVPSGVLEEDFLEEWCPELYLLL